MQKLQFQLRNEHSRITKRGKFLDLSTCASIQEFSSKYHKITCLLSDEEWQLIDLSTNQEIITESDEIKTIWDLYQQTQTKTKKDAQLAYCQFKNDYRIHKLFNECYLGHDSSLENFAKQYCIDREIIHQNFPLCYINWSQFTKEIEIGTSLGTWKSYNIDNIFYIFEVGS